MVGFIQSSIGRKFLMALSAIFLLIFLVNHLSINLISLFSEEAFNKASHFMETNPVVQYIMQPILVFGVIFHFIMGFVLELKNNVARPVRYAVTNNKENSSWSSRNMIISGVVILAFLLLHFVDFWIPTISKNYFGVESSGTPFLHIQEKFLHLWRVIFYCICFILLGLHLSHGFQSSFQSVGIRHSKYLPLVKTLGFWYSVLVPLGFIIVAVYHHITQ